MRVTSSCCWPDFYLLDEPTLGLDPLIQRAFRQLLAYAHARGATVLLSSHVLSEVESLCTRIGLLKQGRLVQLGTLAELRRFTALLLAAIAAGIAAGTALALSIVGEPNTGGAFLTLLAAWCAAVICYGLGLLLAQFFTSAKTAAGVGSTALIVLYVVGNSADDLGPVGSLRYLSPFTYANLSRVLVPGIEPHWPSKAGMLTVAAALIAASGWLFGHRDIAASAWRRPGSSGGTRAARRRRVIVSSLWGDGLYHGRLAMVTWALSAAALTAVMVSLEPAAMNAWEYFDVLLPAAPDVVSQREAQYLGLSSSLIIPFIAEYVVAQSAKWSADFAAGRTALILSAPISWVRLLATRLGLVLTIYLSAAYLLTFIVPMLEWPEWINRLSIFTAFGNPYLAWPGFADALVILVLAAPGTLLAFIVTARSQKSP